MKKLLFVATTLLILSLTMTHAQVTTATNFTVNDCNSVAIDLFNELDGGKVVVMAFVMPCGACTGPTMTAYNKVQEYATTHPGKVSLYIMDDNGTTSCSTLTNWANSNIASGLTAISNTSATQSDYGSAGMPKIVVVGGGAHGVFFNKNNSAADDASGIGAAIDQALLSTAIEDVNGLVADVTLSMSDNVGTLNYVLTQSSDINITLYNTLGSRLTTLINQNQNVGHHSNNIDLNTLPNGIYFVNIKTQGGSQTIKFTVAR